MNALVFSALFIGILIISIIAHEWGHLRTLNKYVRVARVKINWFPPKIQTGEQYMYDMLTKEQKNEVYWSGIVVGLIPIVVASLIHQGYWLLLAPYVLGCMKDVELIIRNGN